MAGLDRSEGLLQQTCETAQAVEVMVRWCHGDMRTVSYEHEFDGVFSVFSSFRYGASQEEDQCTLQQVVKALKPNGLFLLEILPQPRVIRLFSPSAIMRYDDGLIVLEERHIDLFRSRYEIQVTMLFPDGRRSEYTHWLRLYTLAKLVSMLEQVRLRIQAYYGNLQEHLYTLESRLVIVSKSQ
jgi:SAM-dependent methyltransferase